MRVGSSKRLILALSVAAAVLLPVAGCQRLDLQVIDLNGYNRTLEKHRGRVVLVDFWATWCMPCVEHFPKTVEWSRDYADQGLAVIAVSVDDAGSEASVAKFLEKQGARFDTLMSEMGTGTETWEAFDIPGGVPFYKLYDRTGRVRYRFSGNADVPGTEPLDQIERRIKELLAEK